MKKKYIITESQLKLLESGGVEFLVMGCIYGGFWGLATILQSWEDSVKDKKRKKEESERLQKIKSTEDLIFQMIEKNDNKGFSVGICELKDKTVNFVKNIQGNPEFPILIEDANFICDVKGNLIKTYIKLKGRRIGNNSVEIIELQQRPYSQDGIQWVLVRPKVLYNIELYNFKLENYLTDELKFPIREFIHNPKTDFETDF